MRQHRSPSHISSSRRGRRAGTRAVAFGALVVVIAVAAIAFVTIHSLHGARAVLADVDSAEGPLDAGVPGGQIADVEQQLSRRIYPYSVVAGGVHSVDELTAAMANDPVVADHYRDLRPAAMHAEVVNGAHEAYMSYRIADRVYWSKRKLPLHPGETILTDGHEAVRARCGNRLSEVPKSPTSPDEPPAVAFEIDTAPPGAGPVLPSRAMQALGLAPGARSGGVPPASGGLPIAQSGALSGSAPIGASGYASAPMGQSGFAPFGAGFPVGISERRPGGSGPFSPGSTPGGTGDPLTDPGNGGPPFITQVPGLDPPQGPPNGPPAGGPNGPPGGGPPGGLTTPVVQNDTPPPSDHRSVPEPASLALLSMGVLWMVRRRVR